MGGDLAKAPAGRHRRSWWRRSGPYRREPRPHPDVKAWVDAAARLGKDLRRRVVRHRKRGRTASCRRWATRWSVATGDVDEHDRRLRLAAVWKTRTSRRTSGRCTTPRVIEIPTRAGRPYDQVRFGVKMSKDSADEAPGARVDLPDLVHARLIRRHVGNVCGRNNEGRDRMKIATKSLAIAAARPPGRSTVHAQAPAPVAADSAGAAKGLVVDQYGAGPRRRRPRDGEGKGLLAVRRAQLPHAVFFGDTHHQRRTPAMLSRGQSSGPRAGVPLRQGREVVSLDRRAGEALAAARLPGHCRPRGGAGPDAAGLRGQPGVRGRSGAEAVERGDEEGRRGRGGDAKRDHQGAGDGHAARAGQGPEGRRGRS